MSCDVGQQHEVVDWYLQPVLDDHRLGLRHAQLLLAGRTRVLRLRHTCHTKQGRE